jgi:uncharacterized membrane protein
MENSNQNQSTKNALCYIPFLAFVFLFTEQNKSDEFRKNMKYWIVIFIIYIVLQTIFWNWFGGILALLYILISIFLGYKAYNGEKIEIEQIDEFETKIKENMK